LQHGAYCFGIEEEYFLASAHTGALATRVPEEVLKQAQATIGEAATAEFLQSQLEIASPIFDDPDEALRTLRSFRQKLSAMLANHELQLIAASTHPLGTWREQLVTHKPRYEKILSDFRIVGQRTLVCGMHVHVAVPAGIDRVQLMNRAMRWLPMFLALSTSSPFWHKRVTGLLSYRQAVYDEWPRSGIPDFFADEADYAAFAALLQQVDAVRDASYFWWAIRPALRFPTLEMRIADVCTRVEDGVAIAMLYRCLVAALIADPTLGAVRSSHTRRLIDENRWRAKRDGTAARLIDEERCSAAPLPDALAQLLERLAPQIEALRCAEALAPLQRILTEGSSAHLQLRVYNEARARGDSPGKSLRKVTEWLARTTAA
jgi:glutamate---cysteine ligase / carboxylate-amine ligase